KEISSPHGMVYSGILQRAREGGKELGGFLENRVRSRQELSIRWMEPEPQEKSKGLWASPIVRDGFPGAGEGLVPRAGRIMPTGRRGPPTTRRGALFVIPRRKSPLRARAYRARPRRPGGGGPGTWGVWPRHIRCGDGSGNSPHVLLSGGD